MSHANLTSREGWAEINPEDRIKICANSIKTTNYVSTMHVSGLPIDTRGLSHALMGANYNPTFDSVGITLAYPPVTATLYTTGRGNLMGVDTAEGAALAAQKVLYLIVKNTRPQKYLSGEPVVHRIEQMSVHNVVGTVLAFPVDLDKIVRDWGHAVERHEHFTGVTLSCARLNLDPPTTIVITFFPDSGKIIITGARTKEEMYPVYSYVHEHIFQPAERKDLDLLADREHDDAKMQGMDDEESDSSDDESLDE